VTYVEWLRVRNCLRVLAIVLAVCIGVCLILRLTSLRWDNVSSQIDALKKDPGTTVSQLILLDGTHRTVIDDPKKKTHVVVDDRGYKGKRITITGPASMSHTMHNDRVIVGSIDVRESRNRDVTTTVIDTNQTAPFIYYMGIADLAALIVATCLGAPLARENDGHLEIALTKPVSRTGFSLGVIGVDVAGILASSAMAIAALLVCQMMFELPRIDLSGLNAQAALMGVIFPVTWYMMLCAATASLRRAYGVILGLAWPVAILVAVFGAIPWGRSLAGQAFHWLFFALSRIDPLTYVTFPGSTDITLARMAPDFGIRALALAALFVAYAVAAVVQWRRVEA
jgi:hypothetical protein